MIRYLLGCLALLVCTAALAQGPPVGCDRFKWALDHERELLASASQMTSGAELHQPLATAVTVALVPYAEAKLPTPPSRAPKAAGGYAGFITVSAVPNPGTYRVTLSAPAWIDVVQNGHNLQSTAFSGASGCPGIAKSVKYQLSAEPFVIELSNTTTPAISLVVTPD